MIEIAALEEMFANIQKNTAWNMNGPMLWGYFFTDDSKEKLERTAAALAEQGYEFVELFVPELEEGEDEYYFLHVERVEVHTVESLRQRNQELYALAEKFALRSYDGMDVGPAETSH